MFNIKYNLKEIKKGSVWKSQLEMYKKQVTELHHTLNEQTNKTDELEFEVKQLLENLSTLQIEKDVIRISFIYNCVFSYFKFIITIFFFRD